MPTASISYSEKLKDPRWQKKRLEILSRDEFTCVTCGDKESTLNVHHRFYIKHNEPWDYPSWSLVTLCESCRKEETDSLRAEKALLLEAMSRCGATSSEFNDIACSFAHHFEWGLDERFFSALSWAISRPYDLIAEYFAYLEMRSKTKGQAPE